MDFSSTLKKAMVDKGQIRAKELSEQTGVSYYIVLRLLKNDGTCRIKDLITIAEFLNVEFF